MAIGISTSCVFRQFLNGVGGAISLLFNGTDQYAEHSAWTPTGVNFTVSLKYTPTAADIGSLVTILGDTVLQKDASDNLLLTYTDVAAATQTVTLSALTLAVGIEYLITLESDGNGVSITVGADTALNAAVINPSTLVIGTWMASAGATLSAGIVRELVYQDDSEIQNGTFLKGDSSTVYVSIPDITLSGAYTVEATVDYTQGNTFYLYGNDGGATDRIDITGGSNTLNFRSPGSGAESLSSVAGAIKSGQHRIIATRDSSGDANVSVDGASIASGNVGLSTVTINQLFRSGSTIRGAVLQIKITDDTNGDTWEYLLNNITDNGDGTGIAPNTGNTEGPNVSSIADYVSTGSEGTWTVVENNSPPMPITVGPSYRLTLIVSGLTTGGFNINFPTTGLSAYSNGTHEVIATPAHSSGSIALRTAGVQPNAGATATVLIEQTYDGIVNNYDPVTDLVTIPNNTRRYLDPAIDSNIQEDEINADGPELFVPVSLDMGWTDNADGSYDWNAAVTIYMDAGDVLEVGKYYRLRCKSTAITGVVRTGFSGTGFGEYDRRSVIGTGEMDIVIEATGTSLRFFADAISTGTVIGISVKETTSAEIINFDQSMVQS